MSPEAFSGILEKIDKAIGPPESETPEERERRLARKAKAAEIRNHPERAVDLRPHHR